VPLVEHELPTFPEYTSPTPVSRGVRVACPLLFCVEFCRSLLVFLSHLLLAIVLSVLRFMDDSDFGIFKLLLSILIFLHEMFGTVMPID
jgi:hypothetical protein